MAASGVSEDVVAAEEAGAVEEVVTRGSAGAARAAPPVAVSSAVVAPAPARRSWADEVDEDERAGSEKSFCGDENAPASGSDVLVAADNDVSAAGARPERQLCVTADEAKTVGPGVLGASEDHRVAQDTAGVVAFAATSTGAVSFVSGSGASGVAISDAEVADPGVSSGSASSEGVFSGNVFQGDSSVSVAPSSAVAGAAAPSSDVLAVGPRSVDGTSAQAVRGSPAESAPSVSSSRRDSPPGSPTGWKRRPRRAKMHV